MRSTKLQCPNPKCHVTLSIPGDIRGQKVRCAGCGQSFVAPPNSIRNGRKSNGKNHRSKGGSSKRNAA